MQKSSTFAPELIREVFLNSRNLLVISFSVINYVVSMRRPRASGEVSFFLYQVDLIPGFLPTPSLKRLRNNQAAPPVKRNHLVHSHL